MEDLNYTFNRVENCCLHRPQWVPGDVKEVLCGIWNSYGNRWQDTPKEGSESSSVYVARLKDGSFGVLWESEDYTGHGCQCSSMTGRYDTFAEMLSHLEGGERDAVVSRLWAKIDPELKFLAERIAA